MAVLESEIMVVGVGLCTSASAIAASSAVVGLEVKRVREFRGGFSGSLVIAIANAS